MSIVTIKILLAIYATALVLVIALLVRAHKKLQKEDRQLNDYLESTRKTSFANAKKTINCN